MAIGLNTQSGAAIALQLLAGPVTAPGPAAVRDGALAVLPPSDRASRTILSIDTARTMFGDDSFLVQTARGRGDQVEVEIAAIPEDRAAFRARAAAMFQSTMGEDAAFAAALRAGQVEVLMRDEVPDLNLQPLVRFTILRDGHSQGGGGFTPDGMNHALFEEWGKTVNHTIGVVDNLNFYIRWPKPA